jgi:hypothetical protein
MDAAMKMGGPEKDEVEPDIAPGKKCSRCGRFMKGGGYCCSSESPHEGKSATTNPDEIDVELPKAKKKAKTPPKIGSIAEDIFGS